ncbi:hypothetical protein NBRC116592_29910 [Colwellia sp. KU-HH00111]|uniref:YfiR/HmsC family protein n=1 Tax=Colwellia sp. KU-HH00111 TaxID=3127652 RepID=UPI0031075C54
MEAKFTRLRLSFIVLIISIAVVCGQKWAQAATIDYGKATLVSKFAKYVTWPGETRQSKFIIGVFDDENQYQYFKEFFANKGVKGKDIIVTLVTTHNEAKDVNILYLPSPNQRKSSRLADKILKDGQVLLMTEDIRDLSETMVNIAYNKQQLKLTFSVVDDNIADSDLIMPDLSYFVDDKDDKSILSPSPSFIAKTQQEKQKLAHQALKKVLAQKESLVEQLSQKLSLQENTANKGDAALQALSDRLKKAEKEADNNSKKIKAKDKQLQKLETQLNAQKALLKINKQDLQTEDNSKVTEQENQIIELTEQLNLQKQALTEQQAAATNALAELDKLNKLNLNKKPPSSYKALFYVFLLIAIGAIVAAVMMWKKTKDASSQPASQSDKNPLLPVREDQLIKSENFAALGYIATDITYAIGESLDEMQTKFEKSGETKNAASLKPVITLLENFNTIAADQDDTKTQSFDVTAYIQKMLMLYNFEFEQSNIAYNYSGEKALTIKSVPGYIAIALLNVINNSLKHGFDNKGNGKIAVKVEKGAKSGAKIIYSDDGKGMSKNTIKQVFEPFFTTRSDRGYVGVGMSTTYDLIKNKLAGDIKIDSQEGKGTTVTITLP